jgi:hypothetical protein
VTLTIVEFVCPIFAPYFVWMQCFTHQQFDQLGKANQLFLPSLAVAIRVRKCLQLKFFSRRGFEIKYSGV